MDDSEHGAVDSLDAVRTERTLRDVLREIPVDAAVPAGWLVGTEVVKFGDALPSDGVTLRHPDHPRDLLITAAGTDDRTALAVYERDRTVGRRTTLAELPAGATDRETLRDALETAARAAARVERGEPTDDAIDREPAVSLRERVGGVLRTLHVH